MEIIKAVRGYRLFTIDVGHLRFSPGVVSTLLTAAMLYLMVSLGFWQLDRAEYRDNLQQSILERQNLPVSTLDTLPESSEDRRYYPLQLFGKYDETRSFLLDNRIMAGRVGYHVYTPFIDQSGAVIMVNRGFVASSLDRQNLPDTSVGYTGADNTGADNAASVSLTAETGIQVGIQGLLDLVPPRTVQLTEYEHDTSSWPVVLQHVELDEISRVLGMPVYDMILWLDNNNPGSMTHDLPVLNLNSAKNIGYAFQWFAMSTALLVIYLVVNTRRK